MLAGAGGSPRVVGGDEVLHVPGQLSHKRRPVSGGRECDLRVDPKARQRLLCGSRAHDQHAQLLHHASGERQ